MTRVPRRVPPRIFARAAPGLAALALAVAPALGQPGKAARPGPDRPTQEKGSPEKASSEKSGPAVIACPSLANYRMLMRAGPTAAASVLVDPKADHLGCAALARGRIIGVADRVSLGGRDYDCAAVQGTTVCHWTEAGALPNAPASSSLPPARGAGGR